jgi:hypothetical protein
MLEFSLITPSQKLNPIKAAREKSLIPSFQKLLYLLKFGF